MPLRLNRNQLKDLIESKEAGKVPEMSRVKMDRGPGSPLVPGRFEAQPVALCQGIIGLCLSPYLSLLDIML